MSNMLGLDAVLRICAQEPLDFDGLLGPFDPRRNPAGRDLAPAEDDDTLPPLALARAEAVVVGARVAAPLADPADVALRLAALAIEQDAEIVVLSRLDYSGLERFGFRTERIAGATEAERAACERQLKAFWSIEVVI